MTVQLAITLRDDQKVQLEALAEARQASVAAVIQDALDDFLSQDAELQASVQEGLDDIAAGRVYPWEDVKADLRARYGEFKD